jgi:hypothetical protein
MTTPKGETVVMAIYPLAAGGLLVWLSQAPPPVDTTGFSADQRFWYAMASLIVPIVLGVLTLAGSVAAIWQSSRAAKTAGVAVAAIADNTAKTEAVAAQTAELRQQTALLEENVNGKMAILLEEKDERIAMAERVGQAEGKVEMLEKSAAPTVVPVVLPPPPRDPNARTRAIDRVETPSSPPPAAAHAHAVGPPEPLETPPAPPPTEPTP